MGIGNYFYNLSLNPKTDKKIVLGQLHYTEEQKNEREKNAQWLKENSEDIYIKSTNNGNIQLHGYFVKSIEPSDIYVIAIHGYMDNGTGMAKYAMNFHKRGYNVILPDLRGHGESEGDYIGMGWHDRLDIIDWIKYIVSKNYNSKIILIGVSMGGATTMMVTGEDLPQQVKLAIEDCGYTSAWEQFSYNLKHIFYLPAFPILNLANKACKKHAHYDLKEASSIEQIKKSKIPTLFIHGSCDDFVPFKMLDEIYNSATCEKEKLVVEGAGHAQSSSIAPELYWNTIDNFIKKYLH